MRKSESRSKTYEDKGNRASVKEAFAELYEEYLPKVFRYIANRIEHTCATEDLTSDVYEKVLEKFGVELIGATRDAIDKAEDRERFRDAMQKIGLAMPRSGIAHNMEQAHEVAEEIGYPIIIRPSFTLGGTGGGIAYNQEEYEQISTSGIDASPVNQILVGNKNISGSENMKNGQILIDNLISPPDQLFSFYAVYS